MSFLRSDTPSSARLVTIVRAALALLLVPLLVGSAVVGAPADAREPDATPAPLEVTPDGEEAAPALSSTTLVDLSMFCPRPTGRWWEDYSIRGCVEQLSERDLAEPLRDHELAWLDLGALPPFAAIDIAAIDTAIAAYEDRLAAEEIERAAREAAERAAREAAELQAVTRPAPARPQPSTRGREPFPTLTQIEEMMAECGLSFDDNPGSPLGEHPCIAAAWARILA